MPVFDSGIQRWRVLDVEACQFELVQVADNVELPFSHHASELSQGIAGFITPKSDGRPGQQMCHFGKLPASGSVAKWGYQQWVKIEELEKIATLGQPGLTLA